jgi:2-polyprenyl-3-methyl-5-hydroxy-6-metoxy-1,4-benzoquinol methylase
MYIFIGLTLFAILLFLLWRVLSRKWIIPCPAWLGWLVELDNPFTKMNRASFIIEKMDLLSAMKVLDAGCGPGRLTIPIAKKIGPKGMVTALDIQAKMLQRTQEKAKAENLSIHYLQIKLGDGMLKHNQYDRACLVTVLGEIPNREEGLREIFQALKPGGILAISEVIFDPHFVRKSTVTKLAKECGF